MAEVRKELTKTPIQVLQEYCVKNGTIPEWSVTECKSKEPMKTPSFECVLKVPINGIVMEATAISSNKKKSRHEAANKLLCGGLGMCYQIAAPVGQVSELENIDNLSVAALRENAEKISNQIENLDFKTKLKDMCDQYKIGDPEYIAVAEEGPAHNKKFTTMCRITLARPGKETQVFHETAEASKKKSSEKLAAKKLFEHMEENLTFYDLSEEQIKSSNKAIDLGTIRSEVPFALRHAFGTGEDSDKSLFPDKLRSLVKLKRLDDLFQYLELRPSILDVLENPKRSISEAIRDCGGAEELLIQICIEHKFRMYSKMYTPEMIFEAYDNASSEELKCVGATSEMMSRRNLSDAYEQTKSFSLYKMLQLKGWLVKPPEPETGEFDVYYHNFSNPNYLEQSQILDNLPEMEMLPSDTSEIESSTHKENLTKSSSSDSIEDDLSKCEPISLAQYNMGLIDYSNRHKPPSGEEDAEITEIFENLEEYSATIKKKLNLKVESKDGVNIKNPKTELQLKKFWESQESEFFYLIRVDMSYGMDIPRLQNFPYALATWGYGTDEDTAVEMAASDAVERIFKMASWKHAGLFGD